MTESIKATRATVQIGSLEVDGFRLPDGSYRMSLSQAAECIGLTARNAFDFLRSKAFKHLLSKAGGTFDFLPEDTVSAIAELGEGFAIEDDVRRERDDFKRLLLQHGIDP